MKAVVIAAGEGTRMRPLTVNRPKPMLPVAGKPMLEHVFESCKDYVDGFVVVVGYMADVVRDLFGEEFQGLSVDYVKQPEQKGTAHAIGCAENEVDERFLALNADVIVPRGLVGEIAESDGNTLAVKRVENPVEYGVVAVDGDYASSIVEKPSKPPSDLANLGVYAFEPQVFDYIRETPTSERSEREVTDTIQMMIDDDLGFGIVEHDGAWLDVGRPWELLEANSVVLSDLEKRIDGRMEEGATVLGDVVVEEGARLRSGAYVEGPALIKCGADVGPNAYVRGSSVIGEDVRVGNSVEVKNSILMRGAAAGHLSYIGDSVVGENVNFGAGTVVANLRHDGGNVEMSVKGESVDTGRRKLGVVLGDGVKTGVNTSLNAGVKMGVGVTTEPGEVVMNDRT